MAIYKTENLQDTTKNVWFDGSNEIECSIEQVKHSLENIGEHYVRVVSKMPGLTNVELVKQGDNFVTIKTNEGVMHRKNIFKTTGGEDVFVEYNEDYKAGKLIKVKSHIKHTFTTSENRVHHCIVISKVRAPGFLGFFYRLFGKTNIGNAILNSYKMTLEERYT